MHMTCYTMRVTCPRHHMTWPYAMHMTCTHIMRRCMSGHSHMTSPHMTCLHPHNM